MGININTITTNHQSATFNLSYYDLFILMCCGMDVD